MLIIDNGIFNCHAIYNKTMEINRVTTVYDKT